MSKVNDLLIKLNDICLDVLEEYLKMKMPAGVSIDTYYSDDDLGKIRCQFISNFPSKHEAVTVERTEIYILDLTKLPISQYIASEAEIKEYLFEEVKKLSDVFASHLCVGYESMEGTQLFSYIDSIYRFSSKYPQNMINKLLLEGRIL